MKRICLFLLLALALNAFSQTTTITVSTYAGDGTAGLVDGPKASARFDEPFGLCRDQHGNLYIADAANHCIRMIDTDGNVSIFAGTTTAGFKDTIKEFAQFNGLTNLCIDDAGNFYVADFLNQRIRKIDAAGNVTTIAGTGVAGFMDGPDTVAQFNYPRGIVRDKNGNIYIADSWNHRIRKIDGSTGEVTTFAGTATSVGVGTSGDLVDGPDTVARFWTPSGLAIDTAGIIYVADAFNHRIRKVDQNGEVLLIAGQGSIGPNNGGFKDGPGLTARLNTPTDLFVTKKGKLLIGDTFGNKVRELNTKASNNEVTTISGNDTFGYVDGPDSIARFFYPRGITTNEAGDSIFLVDFNNNVIRLITIETEIPMAIEQFELGAGQITLYPNPTSNSLTVELSKGMQSGKIEVYDLQGNMIFNQVFSHQDSIELQTEDWPLGEYLLRISSEGREYTNRFVKQ